MKYWLLYLLLCVISYRWLAAKGIGRICNRLPKDLGDEVVGSVTELLNPLEPNEAWHGACLAIAELGKASDVRDRLLFSFLNRIYL